MEIVGNLDGQSEGNDCSRENMTLSQISEKLRNNKAYMGILITAHLIKSDQAVLIKVHESEQFVEIYRQAIYLGLQEFLKLKYEPKR